jgi:hypothetical protein
MFSRAAKRPAPRARLVGSIALSSVMLAEIGDVMIDRMVPSTRGVLPRRQDYGS